MPLRNQSFNEDGDDEEEIVVEESETAYEETVVEYEDDDDDNNIRMTSIQEVIRNDDAVGVDANGNEVEDVEIEFEEEECTEFDEEEVDEEEETTESTETSPVVTTKKRPQKYEYDDSEVDRMPTLVEESDNCGSVNDLNFHSSTLKVHEPTTAVSTIQEDRDTSSDDDDDNEDEGNSILKFKIVTPLRTTYIIGPETSSSDEGFSPDSRKDLDNPTQTKSDASHSHQTIEHTIPSNMNDSLEDETVISSGIANSNVSASANTANLDSSKDFSKERFTLSTTVPVSTDYIIENPKQAVEEKAVKPPSDNSMSERIVSAASAQPVIVNRVLIQNDDNYQTSLKTNNNHPNPIDVRKDDVNNHMENKKDVEYKDSGYSDYGLFDEGDVDVDVEGVREILDEWIQNELTTSNNEDDDVRSDVESKKSESSEKEPETAQFSAHNKNYSDSRDEMDDKKDPENDSESLPITGLEPPASNLPTNDEPVAKDPPIDKAPEAEAQIDVDKEAESQHNNLAPDENCKIEIKSSPNGGLMNEIKKSNPSLTNCDNRDDIVTNAESPQSCDYDGSNKEFPLSHQQTLQGTDLEIDDTRKPDSYATGSHTTKAIDSAARVDTSDVNKEMHSLPQEVKSELISKKGADPVREKTNRVSFQLDGDRDGPSSTPAQLIVKDKGSRVDYTDSQNEKYKETDMASSSYAKSHDNPGNGGNGALSLDNSFSKPQNDESLDLAFLFPSLVRQQSTNSLTKQQSTNSKFETTTSLNNKVKGNERQPANGIHRLHVQKSSQSTSEPSISNSSSGAPVILETKPIDTISSFTTSLNSNNVSDKKGNFGESANVRGPIDLDDETSCHSDEKMFSTPSHQDNLGIERSSLLGGTPTDEYANTDEESVDTGFDHQRNLDEELAEVPVSSSSKNDEKSRSGREKGRVQESKRRLGREQESKRRLRRNQTKKQKKIAFCVIMVIIAIVVAITLPLLFRNKDGDDAPPPEFPVQTLAPTEAMNSWSSTLLLAPVPEVLSFGSSVRISEKNLAIGAPAALQNGVVVTYKKEGNIWGNQTTAQLFGKQKGGQFGASVALTDEILVVGCPFMFLPGTSTSVGAVYLFGKNVVQSNDRYEWEPIGNGTIWGDPGVFAAYEEFGSAVAISGSGDTIFVGAPKSSLDSVSERGRAYVFRRSGNLWDVVFNVSGSEQDAKLGSAVDVSDDGSHIIVGAPGSGYVEVYKWDNINWILVGTISGSDAGEGFGSVVKFLTPGGTRIAVGSPYFEQNKGKVNVYDHINNDFVLLGHPIIGLPNEMLGSPKSVSGDHKSLLLGTRLNAVKQFDFVATGGKWTESKVQQMNITISQISSYSNFMAVGGDNTTEIFES